MVLVCVCVCVVVVVVSTSWLPAYTHPKPVCIFSKMRTFEIQMCSIPSIPSSQLCTIQIYNKTITQRLTMDII